MFLTKFQGLQNLLKTSISDKDFNTNLEDVEDQIDRFQKKTHDIRSNMYMKEKVNINAENDDIEVNGIIELN
jgi:hypothetical protein